MTTVNGTAPADAGAAGTATEKDLDEVRRQAVDLLSALDRPPRTLRIQAGAVTVDITWDSGDAPTAVPVPSAADSAPAVPVLTSPVVGTFYHAPEPGAEPFVSLGTEVRTGQQIGIVEAMKLMIPVQAERAGRISAVLKGNGEAVEYGEPLFALEA